MWEAFYDEMLKIAQTTPAFEAAIQRGAGSMTPEAYAVGHADWKRGQHFSQKAKPLMKRHGRAAMAGTARKAAPKAGGLLRRLFRAAA